MKETGMKIFFASLLLTAAFGTGVFSQDRKPSPTPLPDSGVVKISTNLIQIDVTVTDAGGRIVTDLKPDEIEIYENGKKQKLTNFSFVSSGKPTGEKLSGSAKDTKISVPQPAAPA